jgi:hypothetical protein
MYCLWNSPFADNFEVGKDLYDNVKLTGISKGPFCEMEGEGQKDRIPSYRAIGFCEETKEGLYRSTIVVEDGE